MEEKLIGRVFIDDPLIKIGYSADYTPVSINAPIGLWEVRV
jgi:hypothetical protein